MAKRLKANGRASGFLTGEILGNREVFLELVRAYT